MTRFCLCFTNICRAVDERRQFEEETIQANEVLNKLKTDNEDIIQYLQRTLQARDDQCVELKERLKGLQLVKQRKHSF